MKENKAAAWMIKKKKNTKECVCVQQQKQEEMTKTEK